MSSVNFVPQCSGSFQGHPSMCRTGQDPAETPVKLHREPGPVTRTRSESPHHGSLIYAATGTCIVPGKLLYYLFISSAPRMFMLVTITAFYSVIKDHRTEESLVVMLKFPAYQ